MSYVASGYVRLPSDYGLHRLYNEAAARERDTARDLMVAQRQAVRRAASKLESVTSELEQLLVAERIRIADQYGARIVPVDP